MTVWLTLLCVLFDFYWIYIKNCGESVPSRPDRTEKIYKSPEDLTKSVRFSGLFFLSRKVYSRGLHRTTKQIEKGSGRMTGLQLRDYMRNARGPPEWIRTDSLFGSRTGKVNQIWFTRSNCPNLPCVWQIPRAAHGRDVTCKPAVWRVCGAVRRHSRTT